MTQSQRWGSSLGCVCQNQSSRDICFSVECRLLLQGWWLGQGWSRYPSSRYHSQWDKKGLHIGRGINCGVTWGFSHRQKAIIAQPAHEITPLSLTEWVWGARPWAGTVNRTMETPGVDPGFVCPLHKIMQDHAHTVRQHVDIYLG